MEEIKKQFEQEIALVENLTDLNELKVKYLGKKGIITELNSKIKEIPNEEKKEYGQKVNALKNAFQTLYDEKKSSFEQALLEKNYKKKL